VQIENSPIIHVWPSESNCSPTGHRQR